MAVFVFIESNTSGTGRLLVRKALDKGYQVAFFTRDPGRYPFLNEEMVHPFVVDTESADALSADVRRLDDVAGVFSSSEYFVQAAATLAREMGCFAADPQAIARCRDKAALADALRGAGLDVPPTRRVSSLEQARTARRDLGSPLVVKPIAGSGSVGVRLHRGDDTYLAHVRRLLAGGPDERGRPTAAAALVQSFVDGPEYSVEVIGDGERHCILGITRKHLSAPPSFVEVGHDFPAGLPTADRRAIEAAAEQALDTVGLRHGPSHIEIRLCNGAPVVVEVNPRLAGGMIPVLMERALGLDVLDMVLDLYAGRPAKSARGGAGAASVGFLVPPRDGTLAGVDLAPRDDAAIVAATVGQAAGGTIRRHGDFRDRIGHAIAVGPTAAASRARLDRYLAACRVRIRPNGDGQNGGDEQNGGDGAADHGRLGSSLHPEALAIVRAPPPEPVRRRTLQMLADIDEAHLLMLVERNILSVAQARPVLQAVQELKASDFTGLLRTVAPRGTYLLYENALIERLGVAVAGVTHSGRSRNDINACLFLLGLRQPFVELARALWRLRSVLLRRAEAATEVFMPLYSQFQPGLPGTLAAYLLAVEDALSRDQVALQETFPALDRSPLGAGAGGGTSFPIDPGMTARLLGFGSVCHTALDAVASRDVALRLLGAVAISGMQISRLAQDYQLWTTLEFGFFELPDDLAGGSSMMPQKKNPYLLEMIKGRAIVPSGAWSSMIAAMYKVPFGNAVEVGTEAVAGLPGALMAYCEAASLMSLVVQNAKARPRRMLEAAERGAVSATAIAEALVCEEKLAFRAAHRRVGAAIARALDDNGDPNDALRVLLPPALQTRGPADWAAAFDHGGGPGRKTTRQNLQRARNRLAHDGGWLRARTAAWDQAEEARAGKVRALLEC